MMFFLDFENEHQSSFPWLAVFLHNCTVLHPKNICSISCGAGLHGLVQNVASEMAS